MVREDLFRGKFSGKVWIHREKNKMVGSDILRGKLRQLWANVAPFSLVYFILVQFYGVTYVFSFFRKHYCDRLLIFDDVKRTIMLRRETVDA